MAKRIFVTATNTDIGKTYSSLRLVEAFSRMGLRVGVFKPIETGVEQFPLDGTALFEKARFHNPALNALYTADIVPFQYPLPAAPYVANDARPIDRSTLDTSLAKIEALCDVVIIEGAGGLMVPVDPDTMIIDLASHFGATVLLVTHCRLGCINDTLLSLAALESRGLKHQWALNCRENDQTFSTISLPYFRDRFKTLYSIQDDIDALAYALLDTIPSSM